MRLRPQRKPQRRVTPARGTGKGRVSARLRGRGGRGARRPGVPLRQRLAGRLPSLRRLVTGLAAAAAVAAFVALTSGPWLRVTEVTWAGEHFTASRDLARLLDRHEGTSLLALDTGAIRARVEALPAVASASVTATLPGRLEVAIDEREVAFVWDTTSARLLGANDGTFVAALPADEALPATLAPLPRIVDSRSSSRLMAAGDRIPDTVRRTAMHLAQLDPAALGSVAEQFSVRIDDEFGFGLVSATPGWEMAFGVYGLDPHETAAEAAARLERQVTAVRTLFATRPEASIGWVDARNPGKVYFRAKG